MKRRIRIPAALLALALLLALVPACEKNNSKPNDTAAPASSEAASFGTPDPETTAEPELLEAFTASVTYPSRGVAVPATVMIPARRAGESLPFAVILHGHGGSNEGLGFIAEALCEEGFASIRMDFSGCGASTEDFSQNNLTNMKEDALRAIDFMESVYGCDPERVSLVGFSMGGRIALELTAEGSVAPEKLMLIAPAASTKELINLFGGSENWEAMKAEAEANGFARYYLGEDYYQALGTEFFAAIERVEDPTEEAAARFSGDALVVWSWDDTVVPAYVSERTARALGASKLAFEYGGHLNGLYAGRNDPALLEMIRSARALFKADRV